MGHSNVGSPYIFRKFRIIETNGLQPVVCRGVITMQKSWCLGLYPIFYGIAVKFQEFFLADPLNQALGY